MRIVIDTNVIMSGVFFGGVPLRVLQIWRDGDAHLVISPEILEEYRRVGEELESRFSGVRFAPFLSLLVTNAEIIEPSPLQETVSRDPDDEKFIACAVAARFDFIVSGDKHLLEVAEYRGVKVVTPRSFVESHPG